MPKTGGNGRSVGRPGWFLLSISYSFFKRAWANTFDFLHLYWQHQNQATHPRSLYRQNKLNRTTKARSSHFQALISCFLTQLILHSIILLIGPVISACNTKTLSLIDY